MDALHLHVDDGVLGDAHALRLPQKLAHAGLGLRLCVVQAREDCLVVLEGEKPGEVTGGAPARAQDVVEHARERRVGIHDPAAEGDAVGLVGELLGIELVEGVQLGVLEDLGMQRGHAVNREAVVDGHVCHVHHAVAHDGHGVVAAILGALELVQLDHDLRDARGNGLQALERPLLERLGKDRVVGVGHHAAHHRDGLVELEAMNVHKQAHQLGDDHGGVCVVNLHHGVVGQVVQVGAALDGLVEDKLGRIGDHEVLLVHAEQAAGVIGVVGVKEEREVLGELALVEVDGVDRHQRVVNALEVKEAQAVLGGAAIAQNVDVVQARLHRKAAELDGVGLLVLHEPVLAVQPAIGLRGLLQVNKALVEEAVVVVQAHAVAGKPKRCDGVQEARGKAAQATVAQGRLDLALLDGTQVMAGGSELRLNVVVHAQLDEVVGEQTANEKLGREVVQAALALVEGHGRRMLADDVLKHGADGGVIELGERTAKLLLGTCLKIDLHVLRYLQVSR